MTVMVAMVTACSLEARCTRKKMPSTHLQRLEGEGGRR